MDKSGWNFGGLIAITAGIGINIAMLYGSAAEAGMSTGSGRHMTKNAHTAAAGMSMETIAVRVMRSFDDISCCVMDGFSPIGIMVFYYLNLCCSL